MDGSRQGFFCRPGVHISFTIFGSGVPRTSKIWFNWSIWSLPRKMVRSKISSAMMQPTDHISSFSVYRSQLVYISGARHHLLKANDYSYEDRITTMSIPSRNVTSLNTSWCNTSQAKIKNLQSNIGIYISVHYSSIIQIISISVLKANFDLKWR